LGTIRFDFDPPTVTSATGTFIPGPQNPLAQVQALTDETTYHLVVATSEPVLPPNAQLVCGSETAELSPVGTPLDTVFEFELRLTSDLTLTDGPCAVSVTAEDVAGNVTIDPEGRIWLNRSFDLPPASAAGFNGSGQLGPFMIEMIGNFDQGRETPSDA